MTAANRPDVALLVYDLRGSGVVRNTLRIAKAARDAGLATEIWVVCDTGDLRATLPADLPLVTLGTPATMLGRSIGSLCAVGNIARALRVRRPRIFFSAGNQIHLFAALAWRKAALAPGETRFIGRASNAVIDLAGRRGGMGGIGRRIIGQAERFQYRHMDHIVAVARELAGDLVVSLGLAPDKISVIPNGVDVGAIDEVARHPCVLPVEADVPLIVGVGRLSRQKNFALLIRAFSLVRRGQRAHLAILGDGPKAQRKALEKLISSLDMRQDVTLAGFQPNPWSWMARSDVFVLSSRWEGSSNALIEALACGCRIVATAIPTGVREVLADGAFGALVPSNDVDAMARAIIDALGSAQQSERQRERAGAYSLDATLSAYTAMLHAQMGSMPVLQRSDT
jgi:glycosyltransferase involved in cell wall biosynthesis